MAEIVLFHHAQGLTEGVEKFAATLRDEGHVVHTPDVYEGHTFATLEEGIGYAQEVGFGALQERAVRAGEQLPDQVVYAGLSLGVMAAQQLAQTRGGARGALLIEACVPASEFGSGWPAGVPVQVHGAEGDPIFAGEGDLDAARELVQTTEGAELFLYPGDKHLFMDSSLATYDEEAAGLLTRRVLDFLAQV